ncbi:siderophore-interacting protein [Nocardioides stalactiti]|uniref:siderophore-interacting protein n=1 Tax=Nocardioides stalactiti TaxID=2755356 RepID=UPI0028AFA4DE|nr:siderophore-interacting protein [Nocardioides stalactiti]
MSTKPAKPTTLVTVTDTDRLGPAMLRVWFEGDLAAFEGFDDTDRYVKLLFTPDGSPNLATMAEGERAAVRSYTVLELDVAAGRFAIDFALHGSGFAMLWARDVAPGATITVQGPGSGYAPDPEADWYLFAGDDAALPAIRQALAALPDDAVGHAVVQVGTAAEQLPLPAPRGIDVRWLFRNEADSGLSAAVQALAWRPGRVDIFIHGEAQAVMQEIRPYLAGQGVDVRAGSISGYWKRGLVDEEFRAWKRELAAAEAG